MISVAVWIVVAGLTLCGAAQAQTDPPASSDLAPCVGYPEPPSDGSGAPVPLCIQGVGRAVARSTQVDTTTQWLPMREPNYFRFGDGCKAKPSLPEQRPDGAVWIVTQPGIVTLDGTKFSVHLSDDVSYYELFLAGVSLRSTSSSLALLEAEAERRASELRQVGEVP
jgi:hypothetical protein